MRAVLVLLLGGAAAFAPLTRRLAVPRSGAKGPVAVAAAPAAAVVAAAGVRELAVACALPTCIGFWKQEYGVSYAYGGSVAACASLVLRSSLSPVAKAHALVHVSYGARLCAFLLWREACIPRFRKIREKIETRAPADRLARAPFVAGCAALYLAMSLPLLLTARAAQPVGLHKAAASVLLGLAWGGFGVAALGDLYKSAAKARRGAGALVVGGPFAVLRHPNYQGEQLLWAASCALGLLAAKRDVASLALVAGSLLGAAGIQFVLVQATSGLNARQAIVFADDPTFAKWNAWKGVEFPKDVSSPSGVSELY